MAEDGVSLDRFAGGIGPLLKINAWADIFKHLLSITPEGFLLQEAPDGRILYANRAAREFLDRIGLDQTGGFGSTAGYQIVTAEGAPYPANELPWARALKELKAASSLNLSLRPEHGRTLIYSARSELLRDADGTTVAVLSHLRDLTDERAAEARALELTTTDDLTGIYNRRYMNQRTVEEIARALRYDHPLSCIMIDIDRFKEINDRYGHPGGDLVLQSGGNLLKTRIRTADVVCRWGGEEFVLLLPETPLDEALKAAERIRRAFEESKWEYGRHTLSVTVSVGVAMFDPAHRSPDDLLRRADQALYEAKQTRNTVRAA